MTGWNQFFSVAMQFPDFFPLTLCLLVGEPAKEFTLPASATETSISDLSTDVDYVVTISAFAGSEESLPITGQLTSESQNPKTTSNSSFRPN